jgi:hypothetical protein
MVSDMGSPWGGEKPTRRPPSEHRLDRARSGCSALLPAGRQRLARGLVGQLPSAASLRRTTQAGSASSRSRRASRSWRRSPQRPRSGAQRGAGAARPQAMRRARGSPLPAISARPARRAVVRRGWRGALERSQAPSSARGSRRAAPIVFQLKPCSKTRKARRVPVLGSAASARGRARAGSGSCSAARARTARLGLGRAGERAQRLGAHARHSLIERATSAPGAPRERALRPSGAGRARAAARRAGIWGLHVEVQPLLSVLLPSDWDPALRVEAHPARALGAGELKKACASAVSFSMRSSPSRIRARPASRTRRGAVSTRWCWSRRRAACAPRPISRPRELRAPGRAEPLLEEPEIAARGALEGLPRPRADALARVLGQVADPGEEGVSPAAAQ